MASIFDVLGNGSVGSILNTLARQAGTMASQAGSATSDFTRKVPGGVGGLLGAGALGALLGNLASTDMLKNVGLVGAGAVAWNFYKKWAARQEGPQAQQPQTTPARGAIYAESSSPNQISAAAVQPEEMVVMQIDPTSELVMRCMVYAAKADGNIDASERTRINAILKNMVGGKDVSALLAKMDAETIDPSKIAAAALPQQAEDIYRLSCSVIDIDHFMERGYLDTLAKALHIESSMQQKIEEEAEAARKQLMAYING